MSSFSFCERRILRLLFISAPRHGFWLHQCQRLPAALQEFLGIMRVLHGRRQTVGAFSGLYALFHIQQHMAYAEISAHSFGYQQVVFINHVIPESDVDQAAFRVLVLRDLQPLHFAVFVQEDYGVVLDLAPGPLHQETNPVSLPSVLLRTSWQEYHILP